MRVFFNALMGIALMLSTAAYAQGGHKPHHVLPKHTKTITAHSGIASWYGKHEQGHRMANGKRYDRFKLTAASRTLPLGTKILVTNNETGLSTPVTITDRGPWVKHRILDLSEASAKKIDCKSLCKVTYTIEHGR